MDLASATASAEPIPVDNTGPEESFETVLNRQLNNKPKLEPIDYAALEKNPNQVTNPEDVIEMDSDEFLKHLDRGETDPEPTATEDDAKEPVKDTKKASKKAAVEEKFSLDDIDLLSDPDEPQEPVADKKPKSKEENFADLRKKAETYENEVKSKEAKLAEYEAKVRELEETLEKTAFEKSPKFQSKFQEPYEKAVASAAAFAKEFAEDEDVANRALSLKGKERVEYIDAVFGGGASASEFLSLIKDAEGKRESLEGAIANYKQTYSEFIQEDETSRIKAEEHTNRLFDRVSANLAKNLEYFRTSDNEEHNQRVQARLEEARKIVMNTASPNKMAAAPFLAVIAEDLISENNKLRAENSRYKNRVREDSSVEPRIKRASTDDESDDTVARKPVSGLDAIRNRLRNL